MTEISRRTFTKVSAWSMPVIAVAVATPLAAASGPIERLLLTCTRLNANGGGQPLYQLAYNDGSTEIVDNGTVNSDKDLQAACRDKGPKS